MIWSRAVHRSHAWTYREYLQKNIKMWTSTEKQSNVNKYRKIIKCEQIQKNIKMWTNTEKQSNVNKYRKTLKCEQVQKNNQMWTNTEKHSNVNKYRKTIKCEQVKPWRVPLAAYQRRDRQTTITTGFGYQVHRIEVRTNRQANIK